MTIEQIIHDTLAADSAVAALVGTRISPLHSTQATARPCITYEISTTESISTAAGPTGWYRATIELGLFADTFKAVVQLSDAVQRTLDGYSGITSGIDVAQVTLDDTSDVEQATTPGTEKPVYVRTQTFLTLYHAT